MRRYVCALAVASSLALLCCHRGNKDALVGKWISVARAKDGTATVTEFRPDGTFTSSFQISLQSSYRLNGNVMVISASDPKSGRTSQDSAQVRIDGGTLYLKSPLRGTEEPMQRLGGNQSGDPPIVGKWGSGIRGAHPAYAEFTRDGKLIFSQTMRQASGTYSVSGDTLTLAFEDAPRQTGTFHFENGSLVLRPATGEEQRLTRME